MIENRDANKNEKMVLPELSTESMRSYIKSVERTSRRNKYTKQIVQVFGVVLMVMTLVFARTMTGQAKIQEGIADQIIRFHVLANSDSDEDQALKLKVKAEVVSYLQQKLTVCKNKEEARTVILENETNLEQLAKKVIEREGYSYDVTVELGQTYFPVKTYGDLTFPEGEYEALRILIGEAEGKNWWCVMFPSLCFVNESYGVVPEDSKDTLRYVLTEEEYESLESATDPEPEAEPEPEYHFWLYDVITDLF